MALFKRKKEEEGIKTDGAVKAKPVSSEAKAVSVSEATVILRPRITEKATVASERGVYVFEVTKSATKERVSDAIRAIYKITPRKVRIVPIARKRVSSKKHRGVFGETKGGKKAYVYLKEGDKIDIV